MNNLNYSTIILKKTGLHLKKIICIFISLLTLGMFTACSKVSDEVLIQARVAVKNGALIVDVRTPDEFRQKHINGAINLPIEAIMKGNILLPKDKEIGRIL